MKQSSVIEDLRVVLGCILTDPRKAYKILTRIIRELEQEEVTQ
jgi:hypothetical protein